MWYEHCPVQGKSFSLSSLRPKSAWNFARLQKGTKIEGESARTTLSVKLNQIKCDKMNTRANI